MADESLQEHLKQQQVGTLKLSEAIRIGARLREKCTIVLSDGIGRTCALGAAAMGRGWDGRFQYQAIPFLIDVHGTPLWSEIGARNDSGESRESIADWLAERGL